MKNTTFYALATGALLLTLACNNKSPKEPVAAEPVIKTEEITYGVDGIKDSLVLDGFVAFDENIKGKRPAILIVHEWWGLNDYAKMRARELAKLGYIAMALDMYGNGQRGNNPDEAGKLAGPFYQDTALAKQRFEAALKKMKSYAEADTTNIAAIGYCFGGTQVLNMANLGEPLKAVVSFHGGLQVVPPSKEKTKAAILVCHGEADSFVPRAEVDHFRKMMDSVGIAIQFKSYPEATHAFSNPEATAMGEKFKLPIRYQPAADTASWNDMKAFLQSVLK